MPVGSLSTTTEAKAISASPASKAYKCGQGLMLTSVGDNTQASGKASGDMFMATISAEGIRVTGKPCITYITASEVVVAAAKPLTPRTTSDMVKPSTNTCASASTA